MPSADSVRPGVNVRLATAADEPALARVLGRAFADDPVMEFVIRARPVAPKAEILLGLMAHLHLGDDSVYVAEDPSTGEIVGAAVWAPPGHWRIPVTAFVRHLRSVIRAIGVRGLPKVAVLSSLERRHPRDPHHYLAIIGTDPAHQGKGVGAALMAPVLQKCEDEGLPAYLESSKESNVPYYGRFRFEVTKPYTLRGGPTMYLMWRDAPA